MSLHLNEQLVDFVKTKSILNKDVTDQTFDVFQNFKKILSQVEKSLKDAITDSRIKIQFRDTSTFEAELKIADDILIFLMHTNALALDSNHPVQKTPYVSKDQGRSVFGMISIYNFLSDSFKYQRKNDIGFLVSRIFINRERHFFMEGKKQLGVMYNDLGSNEINDDAILQIIEKTIQYSIDIDIVVPSFEMMKEVRVEEIIDYSLQASISSGKRVGYRFSNDKPEPEV